jgi:hypothetical protein
VGFNSFGTAILLSPLESVHLYSLLSTHTFQGFISTAQWSYTSRSLVSSLICLWHVVGAPYWACCLLVRPQLLFVNTTGNLSCLIYHGNWTRYKFMQEAGGILCFKQNSTKLWIRGKWYRMLSQSYSGTEKEPAVDRNYIGDVEIVRCQLYERRFPMKMHWFLS